MTEKRIHILIDKLANGTLSKEELHFLEIHAVENDYIFDALEGYRQKLHKDSDLEQLKSKLQNRLEEEKKIKTIAWWKYAVAAVTIGCMFFAGWWLINGNQSDNLAMKNGDSNTVNKEIQRVTTQENETIDVASDGKKEEIKPPTRNEKWKPKNTEKKILEKEANSKRESKVDQNEEEVSYDESHTEEIKFIEEDAAAEQVETLPEPSQPTLQKSSRAASSKAPSNVDKDIAEDQGGMNERNMSADTEYQIEGFQTTSKPHDTVRIQYQKTANNLSINEVSLEWSNFVDKQSIASDQIVQVSFGDSGQMITIECVSCSAELESPLRMWFEDNKHLISSFSKKQIVFILQPKVE